MSSGVVRMVLNKQSGAKLGAKIGMAVTTGDSTEDDENAGVVIVEIGSRGLIHEWNQRNAARAVRAGDVVVEVNGHKEPYAIMSELAKPGTATLLVRRVGCGDSSVGAFFGLATEAHEMLVRGGCCSPAPAEDLKLAQLSVCRAGDIGAEECAICMDDAIDADEGVAKLSCGHAFHTGCLARWMQTRQVCPLCIRDVQ